MLVSWEVPEQQRLTPALFDHIGTEGVREYVEELLLLEAAGLAMPVRRRGRCVSERLVDQHGFDRFDRDHRRPASAQQFGRRHINCRADRQLLDLGRKPLQSTGRRQRRTPRSRILRVIGHTQQATTKP